MDTVCRLHPPRSDLANAYTIIMTNLGVAGVRFPSYNDKELRYLVDSRSVWFKPIFESFKPSHVYM